MKQERQARLKVMQPGGRLGRPGPKRETPRQQEAFELYVESRNAAEVARQMGVSLSSIHNWITSFAWEERADARLVEAARRAEVEAIESLQKRLDDHRKAGELLRRRGVEFLLKNPVETPRDAITAIKIGIELERLSIGLPSWVFDILRMDDEQLERERVAIARLAAQGGPDQPALPDPAETVIDSEWSQATEGSESG